MKKVWILILICFSASVSFAAFPKPLPSADSGQTVTNPQQAISLQDVKSLTIKEYEHRIGKKLSLREKVNFLLLKNHLTRIDEGKRGTAGSAIGGFFLGFLLAPIGVLIAYLLPKNLTLRTWAWIGLGVVAVLALIIIGLGAAFNWN